MLQTTSFVLKRSVKFLANFLSIFCLGITFTSAEINFVDISQNNVDLPEGVDAGSAEAADIDGDGDMDFVIKDFSAGGGAFVYGIKWVRNNGNGSWTVLQVSNFAQTGNTVIHLADMDSDGDIDIITGSGGAIVSLFPSFEDGVGAALMVYSNNGRGSFTAKTILETTLFNRFSTGAKFIEGVTTADMDGDSDPDIVVLQGRSVDRVSWIPNNGNGNYGSPQVIRQQDGFDPYEVDAADVDGDGDIDVVVSYLSFSIAGPGTGEIICMKNPGNGLGQWSSTVVPGSDLVPVKYNMYLADLDQDSVLDIVASGLMRPEFFYYKGSGTGNFEAPRGGDLGLGNITALHISDFDNDKDPDVLLTTSERIVLLEYEGGLLSDSLELQAPRLAAPRGGGSGIFFKDMNGDGSLDIITYGEKITWYDLTLGGGPRIVDTDGDGITDDLEVELGSDPGDANDRPIETGASIGINFLSNRDLGSRILTNELAGYPTVAQTNWNNTNGDATGDSSNLLGGNNTLTDADGNTSRAAVSWASSGTWNTSNGTASGDNKLMNGYLVHIDPEGYSRVDLYNITYANYDVYVYFGSDGNGRSGGIESTTAGQTFSYTTASQRGGSFPNGYLITTNQANGNPAANYCVFRDQSSGSFSVKINRGNGNSGIYGVQIIPTDPTQILDGVGAIRTDAIDLGVLGDSTTRLSFDTLQSSINTEMALFRPDGAFAGESDDFAGTPQSGFEVGGLYSGTWYFAVAEHDTRFANGFSATGGPAGGVFILNINGAKNISLSARVQGFGATWFSFDIRPNPLGLPPENPVPLGILGDGTLPLDFNTIGSLIDTEMALYGPDGDLLTENDDIDPFTRQSRIVARNLEKGTYHIAVGRYDTRFRDGFSVERRPSGSDSFIFRVGADRTIQGAIPAVGVQWFSFEVESIEVPEVAFNSVRLREGNVIISWNTLKGQNYQVQQSNDMKRWVNVGGLEQGTGNVLDYSETASKKQEFFRVVIP